MEQKKFYSKNQISIGTFLASPLLGGWLIAQNYKQLGQLSKARKSNLYGFIATVILFIISGILPEKFPNMVIPLAMGMAAGQLVKSIQEEAIKNEVAAGAKIQSGWKVFGLVLLFILLALLIGLPIIIVMMQMGLVS